MILFIWRLLTWIDCYIKLTVDLKEIPGFSSYNTQDNVEQARLQTYRSMKQGHKIDSHKYAYLIFGNSTKATQWKIVFSTNSAG